MNQPAISNAPDEGTATQVEEIVLLIDKILDLPRPARDSALAMAVDLPQYLRMKYRMVLSRSPDYIGARHAKTFPSSCSMKTVGETFAAPEFIADLLFHIDRMRQRQPTNLTWHLHLPRSAGSKFKSDWERRGGVTIQTPPLQSTVGEPYWHTVVGELARFVRATVTQRRILVSGHFPMLQINRLLLPDDVVVATIRHPVARVKSLFRYARQMCQGGGSIANVPGGEGELRFYAEEWRRNVISHGLDPDNFAVRDFVLSGLCPDGELARYLCPDHDIDDLGEYVRDAGIFIEDAPDVSRAPAGSAVNATTRDLNDGIEAADERWIEALHRKDMRHYQQLASLLEAETLQRQG